jgi:hypothetical protein
VSARSILSVTLLTGPEADVRCAGYADDAPILVLEEPRLHLTIGNHDRYHVTCTDVAFAERLAREAAQFASETARFHANHYVSECICAAADASTQPNGSTPA